jgi:hypothetical protein
VLRRAIPTNLWAIFLTVAVACLAQEPAPNVPPPKAPDAQAAKDTDIPAQKQEAAPPPLAEAKRTDLNLLGQTDVQAGESRRNENIQFNLIDNNALKELNGRLGTTATPISEFRPELRYFGTEFGNKPGGLLQLDPARHSRDFHAGIFFTRSDSIFSARSFFQVGDVKPGHENDYGFAAGMGLWRGAHLALSSSSQKLRSNVNSNVLVPLPSERTPLATDSNIYKLIQHWIDAYPTLPPNRTDVDPRALNINSPQSINTDASTIRLDQDLSSRDRLFFSHTFTNQ